LTFDRRYHFSRDSRLVIDIGNYRGIGQHGFWSIRGCSDFSD